MKYLQLLGAHLLSQHFFVVQKKVSIDENLYCIMMKDY